MHTPMTSSTTIRSGLGIFALGLISVAVLNACGGGDPVKPPATTTTAPTTYLTSSGSVSPTFDLAAAGTIRYFVQGTGESMQGTLTATDIIQNANGALTTITSSNVLNTATFAVQKIMGNADFAQGRWTRGSAIVNGVSKTLTGTDNLAVHYLVMREETAFTPGSYSCNQDFGETGATYGGAGSPPPADTTTVGAGTINARIDVDALGSAVVTSQLIISTFGVPLSTSPAVTTTFTTAADGPKYTGVPGKDYSFGNEGTAMMLGKGTVTNSIRLGYAYRVAVDSYARYQGILSILCK